MVTNTDCKSPELLSYQGLYPVPVVHVFVERVWSYGCKRFLEDPLDSMLCLYGVSSGELPSQLLEI